MKKNNQKTLVKEARKIAKQEIKSNIIEELKKITAKFGKDSKKTNKVIEKGAAQLAKKLSKELNLSVLAADQKVAAKTTATKPATPIKAKTDSKVPAKPAAKKPVTEKEG